MSGRVSVSMETRPIVFRIFDSFHFPDTWSGSYIIAPYNLTKYGHNRSKNITKKDSYNNFPAYNIISARGYPQ